MIMKPHLYAIPGQQFLWLDDPDDDAHVSVIATPTGWLYAIEGEEYATKGWILVPDKDHSMNPRSLIPPGWQDGMKSRSGAPEHQRLADLIWQSGADDAVALEEKASNPVLSIGEFRELEFERIKPSDHPRLYDEFYAPHDYGGKSALHDGARWAEELGPIIARNPDIQYMGRLANKTIFNYKGQLFSAYFTVENLDEMALRDGHTRKLLLR